LGGGDGVVDGSDELGELGRRPGGAQLEVAGASDGAEDGAGEVFQAGLRDILPESVVAGYGRTRRDIESAGQRGEVVESAGGQDVAGSEEVKGDASVPGARRAALEADEGYAEFPAPETVGADEIVAGGVAGIEVAVLAGAVQERSGAGHAGGIGGEPRQL
jgi:hypothetical protein